MTSNYLFDTIVPSIRLEYEKYGYDILVGRDLLKVKNNSLFTKPIETTIYILANESLPISSTSGTLQIASLQNNFIVTKPQYESLSNSRFQIFMDNIEISPVVSLSMVGDSDVSVWLDFITLTPILKQ